MGLAGTLVFSLTSLANPNSASHLSLRVHNQVVGTTSQYIGACEGNVDFESDDLKDLGINTYRIYGGMSRWESEDDDDIYGWPSIQEIKSDPNLINWSRWDQVMTQPDQNSDYSFSGDASTLWQGSARTIFQTLQQASVRPVVTLRNTDPGWNPTWALQLNPPRTEADWNEWWEHVFATVYWLNVRNDYHVDDFEIHNEPDNRQQGWGGTQQDYMKLANITEDAIAYVYSKYLPDRTYYLHAPKTVGGSSWPSTVINQSSDSFDIVNVHNYDLDISAYIKQVRSWMKGSKHHLSQLWLGEWGTYTGGYDDLDFSIGLIQNMIRMSEPGETHVDGSHIFSLYDWGKEGTFEGLIDAEGDRRLSYYAFRMGIRALQGGKPIYTIRGSGSPISAIATQANPNEYYVLIINPHARRYKPNLNLSEILTTGTVTQWEFSQRVQDQVTSQQTIQDGQVKVNIPRQSAVLIQANAIADDTVSLHRQKQLPHTKNIANDRE